MSAPAGSEGQAGANPFNLVWLASVALDGPVALLLHPHGPFTRDEEPGRIAQLDRVGDRVGSRVHALQCPPGSAYRP